MNGLVTRSMLNKLRVLDLFSGIGGFSLGLERTGGFETVAFCEIEEYPRKVLEKHWKVPIYDDVQKIMADTDRGDGNGRQHFQKRKAEGRVIADRHGEIGAGTGGYITDGKTRVGPIDVITGGFPCQDISYAGKGAGIEGERSGLWSEIARLTGELRPQYVILENVSALLSRGLDRVLGDLAEIGYDAEWHCIPASAIGAPHQRDRIWIVAYPQHPDSDIAGSHRAGKHINGNAELRNEQVSKSGSVCEDVADTSSARRPTRLSRPDKREKGQSGITQYLSDAFRGSQSGGELGGWAVEPNVGRVANGIPKRVDRLKGLGNAVVPQIPELIGRAILELEIDNT